LAGSSSTSSQVPFIDSSGLSYNASTNVLTSTFSGNLTGNVTGNADTATTATTATGATNININATTSTDTTTYPVLVGAASTGNQTPFLDSDAFYYNASTGVLKSNSFLTAVSNLPYAMCAGRTAALTTTANAVSSSAVTFPITFTTGAGNEPIVMVTPDASAASVLQQWMAAGISNTGFTLYWYRTNNTATTLMWQAIQMTSTSGPGS